MKSIVHQGDSDGSVVASSPKFDYFISSVLILNKKNTWEDIAEAKGLLPVSFTFFYTVFRLATKGICKCEIHHSNLLRSQRNVKIILVIVNKLFF